MMGLQFGIKDAIDILIVAMIFYEAFRLLRRSGAANLFWGIFAFVVGWFLFSFVFQLELTGALFDRIISVGAIALMIIFQEEIRDFFYRIGARFSSVSFTRTKQMAEGAKAQHARQITTAAQHMQETKTGALIVMAGQDDLTEYTESGESLDAVISARAIENIFFKNTPLHDGALIISKGRLHSAACILPVSKNQNLPKSYGLRHRAALGLSEKHDALVIVVSEETGKISVAEADNMREVNEEQLFNLLTSAGKGL